MKVDSISIETDEDGFTLVIEGRQRSFPDGEYEAVPLRFPIEDPEPFYNSVKAHIGAWLYERDMARATLPADWGQEPEDSGYALDDPKHPTYHERMSELADA